MSPAICSMISRPGSPFLTIQMRLDRKIGERGLTANLAWNLIGESLPVVAAVIAIPILLHRLGADRFGVLTLSWMIAGYFGLFDFGLGRALTQAMAREFSLGHRASAPRLFWTALAMMLLLGAVAGIALAIIAPWLTSRALKIPLALQRESLLGFYIVAVGLPMLISAFRLTRRARRCEPIRSAQFHPHSQRHDVVRRAGADAAVHAQPRVADCSPDRQPRGIMGVYFAAIFRAFPEVRANRQIESGVCRSLLGFGAWITVSNVITPILVYLDRFLIGGFLSMAALTAYSIPMEIIGKTFMVPAAISGVMFPAFARSFAAAPADTTRLFGRSLKLLGLIMFPLCAVIITFAPQIMSLWMGDRIRYCVVRNRSFRSWRSEPSSPVLPGFRSRCCTARIALTSRRNSICSIFRSTRCSCGYVFGASE